MKKLMISTALLAATAGMAAAEVTITGTGRFGVVYNEDAAGNDTLVSGRLRFNIDASKETDAGVTFGGRVRLQYSIGDTSVVDAGPDGVIGGGDDLTESGARLSAAYLYMEVAGFRMEVGNSNTAFDSAALYYDSEVGFISSSFGTGRGDFYSFSSSPYGTDEENRVGLYASYSVGDFTGQISYVDPDQTGLTTVDEEVSIALAYETDVFTVSAAAVQDGAGIADNDIFFLGGAYNFGDAIRVGLLYTDADLDTSGTTVTAFGSYTINALKLEAYVADNDATGNLTDTAYGIGADYDIGGATISGSIQRGYTEDTYADLGVNFSF